MARQQEMRTISGIYLDPFNSKVEDINIEDIAHSLAFQCRANGHINSFFSVAQHCINCQIEAKNLGYSVRTQLFCLLHDATECYLSDLISPVKCRFPIYNEGEEKLAKVIYENLVGSQPTIKENELVKEIDRVMLYHEFFNLAGIKVFDIAPPLVSVLDFSQKDFSKVKKEYLNIYHDLIAKL